ncbi:MAG: hypothetical protein ABSB35_40110 [Bryobacteraceae bacterium]
MIRHFLIAIATAGFVLPMYLSAQCPTTTAPNPPFVPPAPYFANAYPSLGLLYGTASLWTWISTDPESWRGPACCRTQHPFVAKLAYTRARFDARKENDPELTIVATPRRFGAFGLGGTRQRNVGPRRPQRFANMTMLTGLDLPAAGCWGIAARYSDPDGKVQTLSYVVLSKP